jgi:hypothetical protein
VRPFTFAARSRAYRFAATRLAGPDCTTRRWNLTFENNAPRQKGGSTRLNEALSQRSGPRQKAREAKLKFGFATTANEFTEFIVTLLRQTIE